MRLVKESIEKFNESSFPRSGKFGALLLLSLLLTLLMLFANGYVQAGSEEDSSRVASGYPIEYEYQPDVTDRVICEFNSESAGYNCREWTDKDPAVVKFKEPIPTQRDRLTISYESERDLLVEHIAEWDVSSMPIFFEAASSTSSADVTIVEFGGPAPDVVRCSKEVRDRGVCSTVFYKYHFSRFFPSDYDSFVTSRYTGDEETLIVERFSETKARSALSLIEGINIWDLSGRREMKLCFIWKEHRTEVKGKLLNECAVLAAGASIYLTEKSAIPFNDGDPDFIDALVANGPMLNLRTKQICQIRDDWCSLRE